MSDVRFGELWPTPREHGGDGVSAGGRLNGRRRSVRGYMKAGIAKLKTEGLDNVYLLALFDRKTRRKPYIKITSCLVTSSMWVWSCPLPILAVGEDCARQHLTLLSSDVLVDDTSNGETLHDALRPAHVPPTTIAHIQQLILLDT